MLALNPPPVLPPTESNTPIQQFTPNQVDGEVDMLVVHSEESITAIRDQIVPASVRAAALRMSFGGLLWRFSMTLMLHSVKGFRADS